MSMRMRIIYFGTSPFAIPALEMLTSSEHQVVAVVTQPDRPAGRGGKLTSPPVKDCAARLGVPVLQPASCRTPEFLAEMHVLTPDLLVVAAYGQFLPDPLLALAPRGAVNLHGSLLPRLRGAAPIQRAIWSGEPVTGVCLMWMVREMDAGDVIACVETPITPDDTTGALTARLAALSARLLADWLPALESGTAPRQPQDLAAVTFAPPLRKEERLLTWTHPARDLIRHIHALAPSPGATTTFRHEPVKVLDATEAPATAIAVTDVPGTILASDPRHGLLVATGDGVLQILLVQPAGKRAMSGADFLRGARPASGERFI